VRTSTSRRRDPIRWPRSAPRRRLRVRTDGVRVLMTAADPRFVDRNGVGAACHPGEPVAMLLRQVAQVEHRGRSHRGHQSRIAATALHHPGQAVGSQGAGSHRRRGRTDDFVAWLTGQRLQYSGGFGLSLDAVARLEKIPQSAWPPAYDADGHHRKGRGSPNCPD
jgi:hypothetical protein